MTLEVDYVPFAIGGGANVYSPATYQALGVVSTGVEPGLADPQLYNTTARLASMVTAALANYISQQLGINILDDGNLTNLVTNLTTAISVGSNIKPGRIVTASTAMNILITDYAVGFNRTVGIAALTATLPTAAVNQEFRIGDLAGNFNADPVSLAPPAGQSIAGLAPYVLRGDRQVAVVHYYGSNIWDIHL